MTRPLRKVVFPVAGLGTRFLPATKADAKKCCRCWTNRLSSTRSKRPSTRRTRTWYSSPTATNAPSRITQQGLQARKRVRRSAARTPCSSSCRDIAAQDGALRLRAATEALGLGHAVLCAKPVRRRRANHQHDTAGRSDLDWQRRRRAAQWPSSARENAGVIAVEEVPHRQTDKYGIVDAEHIDERAAKIKLVVEKPKPAIRIAFEPRDRGPLLLPGRIFELLEKTTPGAGGEIQLTDAIEALLSEQPVLAYRFEGMRFDCGDQLGLVKATLHMALQDPQIGEATREYLKSRDSGGGERGEGAIIVASSHRYLEFRSRFCPSPLVSNPGLLWTSATSSTTWAKAPKITSALSRRRSCRSWILAFPTVAKMREGSTDEFAGHVYTRGNNPTVGSWRERVRRARRRRDC